MRRLAADFATSTPSESKYLDAYLAYNFPVNIVKTATVIKEIVLRYPDFILGKTGLSVLDIGCGGGAGIFGVYYALKDARGIRKFDVMAIDSSKTMLDRTQCLARWLRRHDPRISVRLFKHEIRGGLSSTSKKKYDIILAVNSLAEIIQEDVIRNRFVKSLLNRLTHNGLVLIIEPALKKFSRRLMKLRDELVPQKDVQVLLPCLHDNPCGLLKVGSRNEWCHQSLRWSPPDFLRLINQGLNREIDVLKFAYLVIAKRKNRSDWPKCYRVVSHLLREKGKSRCFICTPRGRVELVRLDKSRNLANAGFDRISKGVIVRIENVASRKEGYWQLTNGSSVEILK
jgi:ribosomal protein RSM22 (predicted rRNA methylase)